MMGSERLKSCILADLLFLWWNGKISTVELSHTSLWYVEAELATAAVTTEPVVLEQLEMVETMPEPTVIDAAEVVVVTNELLTSDEAFES